MRILIVNAYPPTTQGSKQFQEFQHQVEKTFQEMIELPDTDQDYVIRDFQSIVDFLYEIQSSYVNQAAVMQFNAFDMIFVGGCGSSCTLPWSQFMEKVLVLLRMCLKVNKYLFACGSAMLSLVFLSASNIDRTVYFTNDELDQSKFFIEKSTGDIYSFHTYAKQWQPKANAGIHNNKAAQEFQKLGKYILKAPIYRPFKNLEIYTSKNNEFMVYLKSNHINHYAFEGIEKTKFVACSSSKWDVHTFSFPSAERAFQVLAEGDRGPVVIEYGSYLLATYFDINSNYKSSVQILKNFVRTTVEKIRVGSKVEEKSAGVYISSHRFKVKRNLNIELLYRSAPSSPKKSGEQSEFKHSGFAAKKNQQTYLTKNHISILSFRQADKEKQLKKAHKSVVNTKSFHYQEPKQEDSQVRVMKRQEIIQTLHPTLREFKCESFWIPGQIRHTRKPF